MESLTVTIILFLKNLPTLLMNNETEEAQKKQKYLKIECLKKGHSFFLISKKYIDKAQGVLNPYTKKKISRFEQIY